jgi:hypothetical protein
LPVGLIKKIKAAAKKQEVSKSQVVIKVLEDHFRPDLLAQRGEREQVQIVSIY